MLNSKNNTHQKCSLMILADGFIETEAIGILSALRNAGICSKNVGLTNGLINGAYGILVMPDFTLADLERVLDTQSINMVILPGGERHLASLEADPRIHRLLRQVIERQGIAVIDVRAVPWVKKTIEKQLESQREIIVRYTLEMPIETFAQDLLRRIEHEYIT